MFKSATQSSLGPAAVPFDLVDFPRETGERPCFPGGGVQPNG
jgi:hypothetical protein